MAINKSAKVEIGTVVVWILIAGVVAYVANFGGFQGTVNGWFGNGNAAPANTGTGNTQNAPLTDTANCPTSGQTTFTVNVQDALATTSSSLYPEYYLFNGDGLITNGVLTSTANTITVSCGKDYTLVLLNTTAGSGFYDTEVPLQARIASQTVNTQLTQEGTAKIVGIVNPSDTARSGGRAANITLGATGVHNFDIQFQENASQKGFNQPIIACQANQTSIANLNILGFDTVPAVTPVTNIAPLKRLQASAGYYYYLFGYPQMVTSLTPIVTAHMSVTATSQAPRIGDTITCLLVDQAKWKHALYKTATSPPGCKLEDFGRLAQPAATNHLRCRAL
jgi:hypothetical protein